MTVAVGLDLSMCSTGIACTGTPLPWVDRVRTAKKDGSDTTRRHWTATRVADIVNVLIDPIVIIEAVPTRGAMSIVPLAMLHGVVLDRLRHLEVWTFPASTLKKWATGDGRADKTAMVAAAQALGYQGKQEDEADAWCLSWVGQHLSGSTQHLTSLRSSCLQSATLVHPAGNS